MLGNNHLLNRHPSSTRTRQPSRMHSTVGRPAQVIGSNSRTRWPTTIPLMMKSKLTWMKSATVLLQWPTKSKRKRRTPTCGRAPTQRRGTTARRSKGRRPQSKDLALTRTNGEGPNLTVHKIKSMLGEVEVLEVTTSQRLSPGR